MFTHNYLENTLEICYFVVKRGRLLGWLRTGMLTKPFKAICGGQ